MLKLFGKMLGLLETSDRRGYISYILFSFISIFADIFSISMLLPVLNEVTSGGKSSGEAIGKLAVLGFIVLAKGGFDLFLSWKKSKWTLESTKHLSYKMFILSLKEDLLDHNAKSEQQYLASIRTDVSSVIDMLDDVKGLLINAITFLGYSAVMIYASGWLGLVCSVFVAAAIIVMYLLNRRRVVQFGEKQRKINISMLGIIATTYYAYKEVKNDSRKDRLIDKFSDISDESVQLRRAYSFYSGAMSVVLQSFIQAAVFFALVMLLIVSSDVVAVISKVIVLITLLLKLVPIASGSVNQLGRASYTKKYCESTLENANKLQKLMEIEEKRRGIRQKKPSFERGLFVDNISFTYPTGKPIFENASLSVPVGKRVAVIGFSGVGKTTFLDLVIGLIKAQSGTIKYDDYDIVSETDENGACSVDIGEIISYIPQTVWLGGETVRNNVAFMQDNGEDERIIECLKVAKVWDDVLEMPEGLDTVLGKQGYALSGGQRQRIALARALYKDFKLLIMDEATAALDMETEKAVIDSIREVKSDKTLLIVTHHMSLANECDIIYKIENKKFVRIK